MTAALSPGTVRRIKAVFPKAQRAEVARILTADCGTDLPFASDLGASVVERVRFAVLKLSGGSLEVLRAAVELARQDWRDALVEAGFGDSVHAHLAWLPKA